MMKRLWLLPVAAILITACNEDEHDDAAAHAGPMMNYVRIDDRLATGGHFVDDGLSQVQAEGVEVVIDLRDEPPEGHRERLEAQGLTYVNIPVLWRAPERSAAYRPKAWTDNPLRNRDVAISFARVTPPWPPRP